MSTLTTWNPFRELDEVQNRLSTFFGGFPTRLFGNGRTLKMTDWSPQVDIIEDEKEYLIKADLPEMKKDDVKVTMETAFFASQGSARRRRKRRIRSITASSVRSAASSARSPCQKTRMQTRLQPTSKTVSCAFTCRRAPQQNRNRSRLKFNSQSDGGVLFGCRRFPKMSSPTPCRR